MNPLAGRITVDFADRLLKSDILEESDYERVRDLLSVTSFRPVYYWQNALVLGLPACVYSFLPRRWTLALSLPSISILGVTCAHIYQNSRLFRISKTLDESLHQCLHEIQTRQSITFGLGLSGSSLSKCRQQIVEILRSLAKELRIRTRDLCKSNDENLHLYENFLSTEAKELLGDEQEVDQRFTNMNCIKTLWELCRLFRSEFFFYLFCKTKSESWISLKAVYQIQSTLSKAGSQLKKISDNLRNWKPVDKMVTNSPLAKTDGMNRTKIQLQELLAAIESGELDESRLATAILKIYHQFCSSNAPSTVSTMESMQNPLERVTKQMLPSEDLDSSRLNQSEEQVDQVLEATTSTSSNLNSWCIGQEEEYFDKESGRMILKELQEALVDRANEMRVRERRALAAFYKIDERELEERIEQNEVLIKENRREEKDVWTKKSTTEEEESNQLERDLTVRRLHQLPNLSSELANAIRSSVKVNEEILETSDLSD